MREIYYNLICIFLVVIVGIACFKLGYITNESGIRELNIFSKPDNNCSGLDLMTSSKCLQNELVEFYKYNLSNMKTELTLEQLKEVGGVCWHYADWYKENIESLGFYAKTVTFDMNDTLLHRVTIASNMDAYCVLDQLNVKCTRMEGLA